MTSPNDDHAASHFKELASAVDRSSRVLTKLARASAALQKLKTGSLFGVTGGLIGASASLYMSANGLPIWQTGAIFTALGICLGHVTYRALRGLRAEANEERKLDTEKAWFDENLRRLRLIEKHAPEDVARLAWNDFRSGTFTAKTPIQIGSFNKQDK